MYNNILDSVTSGKQFALYLLYFFLIVLKIGIMIIKTTKIKFIVPKTAKFEDISGLLKKISDLKSYILPNSTKR